MGTSSTLSGHFARVPHERLHRFADMSRHGFIDNGGLFTTIDVPGATGTGFTGINNSGQIVGTYQDANSLIHSFVYDGGAFITLPDLPGQMWTEVMGINDAGQIVVKTRDANGHYHGFLGNPVPIPATPWLFGIGLAAWRAFGHRPIRKPNLA